MPPVKLLRTLALVGCTAGCVDLTTEVEGDAPEVEDTASILATNSTRWKAPRWVLRKGWSHTLSRRFKITDASGCWSGRRLRYGARRLKRWMKNSKWPYIAWFGGYSCRRIVGGSGWSIHSTGRAIDVGIRLKSNGGANNRKGDPIGNWMIRKAKYVGIQRVIWDCSIWQATPRSWGRRFKAYCGGGRDDHDNHLHIEMTVYGSRGKTRFFRDRGWNRLVLPPGATCGTIDPLGETLEPSSDCLQVHTRHDHPAAPAEWDFGRGETDDFGHFVTDLEEVEELEAEGQRIPLGEWALSFAEEGRYVVEVKLDSPYSAHSDVHYVVEHAGDSDEIVVAQGGVHGWQSLGVFSFDRGSGQGVRILAGPEDPLAVPGLEQEGIRSVALDAIRLRRIDTLSPEELAAAQPEYGNYEDVIESYLAEDAELERSESECDL